MKSACTRRDGNIKPSFSSIFTQKCVGFTRLRKIGKIYLIRIADRRDRRHIVKCGALDSRACLMLDFLGYFRFEEEKRLLPKLATKVLFQFPKMNCAGNRIALDI